MSVSKNSSLRWVLVLILISILAQTGFKISGFSVQAQNTTLNRSAFQKSLDTVTEYVVVTKSTVPVYANSYLLMDGNTAEVIVSKNADQKVAVASTTKMTTALVSRKLFKLDDVATVSPFPTRVAGSKIGLLSDEQITVQNLLKGLLIASGNDTAFTLAEVYSKKTGDYQQFVTQMNQFVQDHHLKNTSYSDPAGLDDEKGRSTAFDLAQTARILLEDDVLAHTVATPSDTASSLNGRLNHTLKNTNRLIQADSSYYLTDAVGVKTGFTLEAGHCLVAARKLSDRYLIGVVLNTTETTNEASAHEMKKLFNWADKNWHIEKY